MSIEIPGTALILNPQHDPDGAFAADPQTPLVLKVLNQAFGDRAALTEIGTVRGAGKALERFPEKSTRVFIYLGHGEPGFVQSGSGDAEDGRLSLVNLQKYRFIFDRLHPQCTIVFTSCCQGDNILAREVHRISGRTVCAIENDLGYRGNWCLLRGADDSFKAHFFNLNGDDVTGIWENGNLTTFRDQSDAMVTEAYSQGYFMYYGSMPTSRLQRIVDQTQDPYINFVTGYRYLQENQLENAIRYLKIGKTEFLDAKKYLIEALYSLGDQYSNNGEIEKAIACFREAAAEANLNTIKIEERHYKPNPPLHDAIGFRLIHAIHRLGARYQNGGKLDDALRCFEEASQAGYEMSKNGLEEIYMIQGKRFQSQGRLDAAIECFEKAATYPNAQKLLQRAISERNAIGLISSNSP